ncbi:ribonuclease [Nocardioides sp. J2M5]|uniref:ribonuclease domain-containing protein n=1 Tax=Nocardioides palaemonis TaxID=2829810 RepID=UPI001BA7E986|nr:ribonuclease domain-containing protein [Nocardioides palaemonis]MBS2937581.1 ribonuclease [Nocardioides palaemonis]
MAAGAGRQRFRWLLLLVAAVLLLVWAVGGGLSGGDGDAGADGPTVARDTTSTAPTSDPTSDPTTEPGTDASTDPDSGLPLVRLADLPREAARTVELIDRGGPFPEDEDDGVFGNREDLLPDQPYGYYREYTVPTPGADTRGARRIVAGDGGELYWTADHYQSFSRIVRTS